MSVLERMAMPSTNVAWLKGLLGYDTTAERVYEIERKEYVVQTNDGTVYTQGHAYTKDDDVLIVKEADDDVWAIGTIVGEPAEAMKPLSGGGFEEVDRVTGVEDVNSRTVGTDRWVITVDVAEIEFIDTEHEFVTHQR